MSVMGLDLGLYIGGTRDDAAFARMSVAFERAGAELAQFGKHVFPKLTPIFEAAAEGQFEAEGAGPRAGAWAPLSRRYAEWKEEHFPGKGILERTGRLREALTASSSPFAERSYSATDFNFGTRNVQYASYHQVGTEHMVARPFFDFGSDTEEAIRAAALEAAREAVLGEVGEFVTDETGARRTVLVGSRGGRYYLTGGGERAYLGKRGGS